jgi:hypothetical protein
LASRCASAASNFLYDLDKKVDYVSFITTENWRGEEEDELVFGGDGGDGYDLVEGGGLGYGRMAESGDGGLGLNTNKLVEKAPPLTDDKKKKSLKRKKTKGKA